MSEEVNSLELAKQSPGQSLQPVSHTAWSSIRALGLAAGAVVACRWGLIPGEALTLILVALAAPNTSVEDLIRRWIGGVNRQH
jgi:hypothetical protein